MTDLSISLMSAAMAMIGLTIVSLVALRGWSQWIALRRSEIEQFQTAAGSNADNAANTGNRIEIADLRERIRKLEAIAAGVDL
jgi:hypothetical protein